MDDTTGAPATYSFYEPLDAVMFCLMVGPWGSSGQSLRADEQEEWRVEARVRPNQGPGLMGIHTLTAGLRLEGCFEWQRR